MALLKKKENYDGVASNKTVIFAIHDDGTEI